MRVIGIVRHGITDWNEQGRLQGQIDTVLNERGRKQAAALGERFLREGWRWDSVISSDLTRARATAVIIADTIGLDNIFDDERLRERSFGLAEGTTLEERINRWGEEWYNMPLQMESDVSILARGRSFFADLLRGRWGPNALIVSHGGFIRRLLNFFNVPIPRDHLHNASLTLLRHNGREWELLLFNNIDHLRE